MGRLYLLALSIAGLVTVISVMSETDSAPQTPGEAQAQGEPAPASAVEPAPVPQQRFDGGPACDGCDSVAPAIRAAPAARP